MIIAIIDFEVQPESRLVLLTALQPLLAEARYFGGN